MIFFNGKNGRNGKNGGEGSPLAMLTKMAAYELLLRVADCRLKLQTIALNAEVERIYQRGRLHK